MDAGSTPASAPSTKSAALAELQRHGGCLTAAAKAFPRAQTPWIDLSTGVNPVPYPLRGKMDFARLPDPTDVAALEAAAAKSFGTAAENVIAVAGSDAALHALPRLLDARTVGIVSPTYGGHAEAWRTAGRAVTTVQCATLDVTEHDAVVIVNPNNPDGSVLPAADLRHLAAQLTRRGAWLIIDEAFAEVTPEISVAAEPQGRLIVLRSFGKFYGLPGVRLGFIVAHASIARTLRPAFGDWPLNAAAIAAGLGAYADTAWQERTRRRLASAAKRLDRLLRATGFDIVGGSSLFRLARHQQADACFHHLAQAGILTRRFGHDPCILRFGLPAPSQWKRLTAALESWS